MVSGESAEAHGAAGGTPFGSGAFAFAETCSGLECKEPQAVPLRFGEDSFFPHLAASRAHRIEPCVVRLPGFAFDVDNPQDLHHFAQLEMQTRAGRLIAEHANEMRVG